MLGIIVSGHGEFATSFENTIKYIIGTQQKIKYINFNNQISKNILYEKFKNAIDELHLDDQILFITDLIGGTPFSVAVEISLENNQNKIKVIGGANLPTLLSALERREESDNLLQNIEEIVEDGKNSINIFSNSIMEQNNNNFDDGI